MVAGEDDDCGTLHRRVRSSLPRGDMNGDVVETSQRTGRAQHVVRSLADPS
jgi:hypothetical protein